MVVVVPTDCGGVAVVGNIVAGSVVDNCNNLVGKAVVVFAPMLSLESLLQLNG